MLGDENVPKKNRMNRARSFKDPFNSSMRRLTASALEVDAWVESSTVITSDATWPATAGWGDPDSEDPPLCFFNSAIRALAAWIFWVNPNNSSSSPTGSANIGMLTSFSKIALLLTVLIGGFPDSTAVGKTGAVEGLGTGTVRTRASKFSASSWLSSGGSLGPGRSVYNSWEAEAEVKAWSEPLKGYNHITGMYCK